MKIDFFEVDKEEENYIKHNLNLKKLKVSYYKEELGNLDKIKDSEAIVVFVNSKVDKTKLDKLNKLKYPELRHQPSFHNWKSLIYYHLKRVRFFLQKRLNTLGRKNRFWELLHLEVQLPNF